MFLFTGLPESISCFAGDKMGYRREGRGLFATGYSGVSSSGSEELPALESGA